jgi:hypothetical protein
MMVVTKTLFRSYRLLTLGFLCVIAVVAAAATAVNAAISDVRINWWSTIGGEAVRWWMLVLGTLLVATHLKLYVANGVTRRTFLLGAGTFGAVYAAGLTAVVLLGRGVEQLLWSAFGTVPADYPRFSPAELLNQLGHVLPGALAGLVTGALVAAAFYRFTWWVGLLLVLPGALPVVSAALLLGFSTEVSQRPFVVPVGAAVALTVALAVAGAFLIRRILGDVTIQRTVG